MPTNTFQIFTVAPGEKGNKNQNKKNGKKNSAACEHNTKLR